MRCPQADTWCASLSGFETRTVWVDVEAGPATRDLTLDVSSFSDRVTVTATKTGAADIQTTPIAVTALPGRTLEQLGIQTVEGLAGFVPTLIVSQHTGAAQVTIRGIGTNSTIVGADPSSTVHLDGVYLGRPVMVFSELMNIERIEVLRGPQGTPYAMALVHAGLGQTDLAFEWLDRAIKEQDVHLVWLVEDPKWDPYREDPRFHRLVERCNFMRTSPAS